MNKVFDITGGAFEKFGNFFRGESPSQNGKHTVKTARGENSQKPPLYDKRQSQFLDGEMMRRTIDNNKESSNLQVNQRTNYDSRSQEVAGYGSRQRLKSSPSKGYSGKICN